MADARDGRVRGHQDAATVNGTDAGVDAEEEAPPPTRHHRAGWLPHLHAWLVRSRGLGGTCTLPGIVALLAWIAPSTTAAADVPAAALDLVTSGCGAADEEALRRWVEMRLQGSSPPLVPSPSSQTRALLACLGDAAEIAITDAGTGQTVFRRVSLVDVPDDQHARVAALALADLILAHRLAPDPATTRGNRLPPWRASSMAMRHLAPASEPELVGRPPARRPSMLDVAGRALGPLHGFDTVSGGVVGVSREPAGSGLLAKWEAGGAVGSLRAPGGSVSATMGGMASELGLRWRHKRVYLDGVLGFRWGWAWLHGIPFEDDAWTGRESGMWAGMSAKVAVGLVLKPVAPSLSVEVGEIWRPVRGIKHGVNDIGMAGTWVGVKLKLSWKGKRWERW